MIKQSSLLILIGIIFLFLGCDDMILEYENIGKFKIEKITENKMTHLVISGHSLHSSLNIKEVKEKKEGSDITILVYLTLFRNEKSPSGTFNYNIKIDDNIDRILFGTNKKVIWDRYNNE